jgi:hypothetical protein
MALIKSLVQAPVTMTSSGLASLATGTYYLSPTILNHSTNDPLEVLIDVQVTPGTVSANQQLLVFAQASLDTGSNFTTGPTSGTSNTNEANLYYVGVLPLNTNSTAQRKIFSLATAYGGTLPIASQIVFKNDSGAALSSTAGNHIVRYSEVWGEVA